MEEKHKLLVLYATQTGNAMDAAERIGREAERRACPVSLLPIDQFDPVCMLLYVSLPFSTSSSAHLNQILFCFLWGLYVWGLWVGIKFGLSSALALFESWDLHMSFFCIWVLLELIQDLTFFVKYEKLVFHLLYQ